MVRQFSVIELMGMSSADPSVSRPFVYASDYDVMVADRDQISLTLAVAKADRDKWFNRAKALEAKLADAKLEGSRHANRVLKAQVGARDARIAAAENMLACTRDGVSDWLREQISVFLGSAPETEVDEEGIVHPRTQASEGCEHG